MSFAKYQFLPWARRGMSAYISENDTLGKSAGTAVQRASVHLSVELNGDPNLAGNNDFQMIGPGDIVGIKADMIIRTEPLDNVAGFEPNYLPYVEFYDEDFPWRYTPAKAVDAVNGVMENGCLRPWLALIVLKVNEFEDTKRRQPLPSIVVTNPAALPPHDELHLWAHGHNNQNNGLQSNLENFLESLESKYNQDPDGLYSRILCPRRLDPDAAYHAFLVPSYETGRLAGLGRAAKDVKAQQPSWGPNANDFEFPVFHRWFFRTGADFDFESLVRLLEPRIMDDRVGTRPMDCSRPGYVQADDSNEVAGVEPNILYLEGALLAPQTQSRPEVLDTTKPFVEQLTKLVVLNKANLENKLADPIVTVPFYGMYHAMEVLNTLPDFVPADQTGAGGVNTTKWQNELNRDPRWRVAAGFGTRMVQENQEKFMDSAWKQLKNVLEANKKLQAAQFNAKVADKMFAKHIEPLTDEKIMTVTRAVSSRIPAAPIAQEKAIINPGNDDFPRFQTRQTVKNAIKLSSLPAAALSHPFRRAMRSNSKVLRRLEKSEMRFEIIKSAEIDTSNTSQGFSGRMNTVMLQGLNENRITAAPAISFTRLDGVPDKLPVPVSPDQIRVWSIKSNTDADFIYNLPDSLGGLPEVQFWKFVFGPGITDANVFDTVDPGDIFMGGNTDLSGIFTSGGGPVILKAAKSATDDFSTAFGALNQRRDFAVPAATVITASVSDLSENTRIALQPSITFKNLLRQTIRFGSIDNQHTSEFLPVMAYPDYAEPTYEYLVKIDKELLLPNVDLIPQNTLSLLRTNQRFIESYLVGLNYEMGRELLWREYPTDMRGSYFRQFWDVRGIVAPTSTALGAENAKDIKPIHTWNDPMKPEKSPLGRHNARDDQGDASQLVFVVRGELLKKYPNTVIYAHKAMEVDGKKVIKTNPDFEKDILFPKYKAEIDPDIKLYGFDLTIEQAAGADPGPDLTTQNDDKGWFFIIAEVPGEPRFGMDLTYVPGNTQDWNDISWQNFGGEALDFIRAGKIPGNTGDNPPKAFNTPPGLNGNKGHWARSSADMATILFQKPVMIATHATEMLDRDILNDNLPLTHISNNPADPAERLKLRKFTRAAMNLLK